MEPLRGVWDWEKVEDLEVLIAPAGGKFGGSSVIGLTWRGGTFAEFYRKVSASPPPRPPPIIFFKPFTSDLASPHAHTYILTPTSFSVSLSVVSLSKSLGSCSALGWCRGPGPGGFGGAQHAVRGCGGVRGPLSACAGGSRAERPGETRTSRAFPAAAGTACSEKKEREITRGAASRHILILTRFSTRRAPNH